jgi:hypothetical protein
MPVLMRGQRLLKPGAETLNREGVAPGLPMRDGTRATYIAF